MSEKKFKIPGEQIKRLIPSMGGCMASDKILVDGELVGYMYRERPKKDHDSGWCFFSGAEDQAYTEAPKHFAIYDVNTVANYDPAIIPYLESEFGRAYERVPGTPKFQEVSFAPPED
jgi:hypothetical protein